MIENKLEELKEYKEIYMNSIRELEEMELTQEERNEAKKVIETSIIHESIALDQFN